ncbi:MAG TPA: type IV pilus biogenesis/stability protein PilW [Methylibium sp.]|nr:type IV pilus biogenesis/stability protein PilW [Methylibium sp.]
MMDGLRLARGAAPLVLLLALLGGTASAQNRPGDSGRDRVTTSDESETQRRARIRLDLAAAYFADGKLTTALDEVKQALVISPDMPQALNLRGLIYGAMGEEALADESYKRGLQVAPTDADMLHNYGWHLCMRNRVDEALPLFDRALAVPRYRTPSRTLLAKGVCESRAGRLETAEATLKRAYELDAGNPATAMNLADVLLKRGELDRARFYVRRVNQNGELRNAESLWLAARIEHKLGNVQGARDLGYQLRANYPDSSEAAAFGRGGFDE